MSNDPFGLDGRVFLVTGAAGGIGRATAAELASAGAAVMLTDRDPAVVETAAALADQSLTVAGAVQDVTDEAAWIETVAATLARFGRFDGLINNAGMLDSRLIVDTSVADWERVMRVNVTAILLGLKHAAGAMRPGGSAGQGGVIVNLSSTAAYKGSLSFSAYSTSKAAVRALTRNAAVEFAALGYGIRVNSVHPGLIDTRMGADVFKGFAAALPAGDASALAEQFRQTTPLQRFGKVDEIAQAIRFLCCDASRFATGTELIIDGGLTAS
jgi:NAD(P)-dependent dehydrogenase (short-subunit alcohol dehydrogenase family)